MVALLGFAGAPHAAAGAAGQAYQAHVQGRFVVFRQSGFEPDGDPLDRAVVSATLASGGPSGYPNLTLVLSTYLENFQPRTAPELPDILHPDQVATSLAGFMQGKAALVGSDGHIAFWGSLLAETFFDNTVHMELALSREGAPAAEPALHLLGTLSVRPDRSLAVQGSLHATDGLTPRTVRALSAQTGKRLQVSWQRVLQNLTVSVPRMMGTSGNAAPAGTPTDLSSSFGGTALGATHSVAARTVARVAHGGTPAWRLPAEGAGAVLIAGLGVAYLLIRARRRASTGGRDPAGLHSIAAGAGTLPASDAPPTPWGEDATARPSATPGAARAALRAARRARRSTTPARRRAHP